MRRRARIRIVLCQRADTRDTQEVEVIGETLFACSLEKRVEVGEIFFADPRRSGCLNFYAGCGAGFGAPAGPLAGSLGARRMIGPSSGTGVTCVSCRVSGMSANIFSKS